MLRNNRPILLLEDNMVDFIITQKSFSELNIPNELIHKENGEEGIAYLEETNSMPCLILSDINMPRMNGIEFLKVIKKQEKYKRIPVVMLTTSKEEQDRFAAFDLGIAGYMVKPIDYTQFLDIVDVIQKYWNMSELPV